ncbi:MAG: c-type cytochrome [Myxococcus sp.]|nr:c-type cytochrome [Myxococcus sp.]
MESVSKKLSLVVLVSCVAVAAPGPEAAAKAELKRVTARKGDVVRGKETYQAACASCHLDNGAGQPDGTYPQLAGQHPVVVLKQLADIRAGARENAQMLAPTQALGEQELADVAAYLKLLPIPRDNGRGEGELLDDGLALYKRDCLSCHGRSGEGNAKSATPVLAGQHFKYLVRQATEIRDGTRKNANPKMMDAIKGYTDTQIVAVADFMSRLVMPELPKPAKQK